MKLLLFSFALLLAAGFNSFAQTNALTSALTNTVSTPSTNPVAQAHATAASATQTNAVNFGQAMRARDAALWVHRNLMQRIFGMNVSYSGALVPRSEAHRPPVAPAAPGYPFENISVNPITGRAEGITLLSIHF